MADKKTKEYAIKLTGAAEVQKAIETIGKDADSTGKSFKSLNQILAEGQKQLALMTAQGKEGTKEYEEMAKALGGVKDAIGDAQAATNDYANDTKNLTNALDVFKTGTAVVGLFSSALVSLGADEGKVAEVTNKLIAIQTALNSVTQIQATLMNKSSGTYRVLHKLKQWILGDTKKETVATTALSTAEKGLAKSTTEATKATRTLRVALISTGFGIIAIAIGLLVENWDKFVNIIYTAIPGLKTVGEFFSSISDSISDFFDDGTRSFEGVKNNVDDMVGHLDKVDGRLKSSLKTLKDYYNEDLKSSKKTSKEKLEIYKEYYAKAKDLIEKHNKNVVEKEEAALDIQQNKLYYDRFKIDDSEFKKYSADIENYFTELAKIGDKNVTQLKSRFSGIFPEILYDSEKFWKEHEGISSTFLPGEIRQIDRLSEHYKNFGKEAKIFFDDYIKNQNSLYENAVRINKLKELEKELDIELAEYENKASDESVNKEKKRLEEENKIAKEREDKLKKQREKELEDFKKSLDNQKKALTRSIKDEIDILSAAEADKKTILDERYKLINAQYDLGIIDYQEYIKQLTLLDIEYNKYREELNKEGLDKIAKELDRREAERKEKEEKEKERLQTAREQFLTITNETLNTAAGISSSIFELINADIDRTIEKINNSIADIENQLNKVDKSINRHINRLNGYYEALSDSTGEEKQDLLAYIKEQEDALSHQYNLEEQLEKQKYEREKQLKREEARQKKVDLQNQLIQAIITGATTTLNGFATQPFLPLGIAMGALAATLSAVQIGVISSNIGKIKYANGGLLQGPSHNNGGIRVGNTGIEVEGGEYIVNKKATKKYLPVLEEINDYGRSTSKFANGGQMNLSTNDDKTSYILSNLNFSPVVSVVDINRENNRLSKVRVLSQS